MKNCFEKFILKVGRFLKKTEIIDGNCNLDNKCPTNSFSIEILTGLRHFSGTHL
jgi:hypothetical protein